jgi:prophage regulatory protein
MERLLRMPTVKEKTGLSRASIYRFVEEGRFPPARSLGAHAIGWLESEVEAWIQSRRVVQPKGTAAVESAKPVVKAPKPLGRPRKAPPLASSEQPAREPSGAMKPAATAVPDSPARPSNPPLIVNAAISPRGWPR